MKGKKIFAPILMLMAAILAVMTACSRVDESVSVPQTGKKPEPTNKTIGNKSDRRPMEEMVSTEAINEEEMTMPTDTIYEPSPPMFSDLPDSDEEDELLTGWDLNEFLRLYSLDYKMSDGTIEIFPQDHSFLYTMFFDNGMVRGNKTEAAQERYNGGVLPSYDSATDFIFTLFIGDRYLSIGADELDVLYTSVRLLTAPLDKMAEVRDEIAREYAEAYNTEGIPETFIGEVSE